MWRELGCRLILLDARGRICPLASVDAIRAYVKSQDLRKQSAQPFIEDIP
jgi:hypothetical protein